MLKIFGNGTDAVSWTAEPIKRGTFSILSSCVITILLCVWTAVHLNIPEHKDQKRPWYAKRQLWRKTGWLLLTLLAPELVAYSAFFQLNKARGLRTGFQNQRAILKTRESGREGDIPKLSMTQAFYATMGGYVLEVFDDETSPFPGRQTQFTLQCGQVQELAEVYPYLLPRPSDAEIKDKSKASNISKSVVCFQASWFVLQCITRMVLGLPVTLLELNTFGHALCALLIYVFWWYKPLDIDQPTPIKGKQAEQYAAYLWLTADREDPGLTAQSISPLPISERYRVIRDYEHKHGFEIGHTEDGLISQNVLREIRRLDTRRLQRARDMQPFTTGDQTGTTEVTEFTYRATQPLLMPETNPDVAGRDDESNASDFPLSNGEIQRIHMESIREDLQAAIPGSLNFRRHSGMHYANRVDVEVKGLFVSTKYADKRSTRIIELAADLLKEKPKIGLVTYKLPSREEPIVARMPDFPPDLWDLLSFEEDSMPGDLLVCLFASGVLYGGLHALAWYATFHSPTECLLWRLSAVTIMAFLPAAQLSFLMRRLAFWVERACLGLIIVSLCVFLTWTSLVAYFLARGYLVVECFLALAHSPFGVYDVPQWSTYVPHIT